AAGQEINHLTVVGSTKGEHEPPAAQPRDSDRLAVQGRFAKERVVATALEGDRDPIGLDPYSPPCPKKTPIELLGRRLLEAAQSRPQPAIATVSDHRQRRIEVDVQPHLAGQAIEVEEVHADAQPILDPVATGIADDQLAGRLLEV